MAKCNGCEFEKDKKVYVVGGGGLTITIRQCKECSRYDRPDNYKPTPPNDEDEGCDGCGGIYNANDERCIACKPNYEKDN